MNHLWIFIIIWLGLGIVGNLLMFYRFYQPWWYSIIGIFLSGPIGLFFVLYVMYAIGQEGDK